MNLFRKACHQRSQVFHLGNMRQCDNVKESVWLQDIPTRWKRQIEIKIFSTDSDSTLEMTSGVSRAPPQQWHLSQVIVPSLPFQLWIINLDRWTGDDEDVNIPLELVSELRECLVPLSPQHCSVNQRSALWPVSSDQSNSISCHTFHVGLEGNVCYQPQTNLTKM